MRAGGVVGCNFDCHTEHAYRFSCRVGGNGSFSLQVNIKWLK